MVLTLAVLSTGTAQAVGTRSLATNNVLYGFDGAQQSSWGTLSRLNPTTGAATTVGSRGTYSPFGFPYQPAFDPTSGAIYWINSDFNNATPNYLMKANTETGQSILIGEFLAGSTATAIDSLVITPAGLMYGFADRALYSVNKTTGALTLITSSLELGRIYSAAYNPADQKVYIISNENGAGLATVELTTGAMTPVLPFSSFPNLGAGTSDQSKRTYSMTFDQSGNMWAINLNGDLISSAITTSSTAGTEFVDNFELVGTPGATMTTAVVIGYPVSGGNDGGSELANTGTEEALTTQALAVATSTVALGIAMMLLQRRRKN